MHPAVSQPELHAIRKLGQQITRHALKWNPQGKRKRGEKHLVRKNGSRYGKAECRRWQHLETQAKDYDSFVGIITVPKWFLVKINVYLASLRKQKQIETIILLCNLKIGF